MFNEIWAWIVDNLTPFLTGANLLAVVSVIVSLFRQKRTITDNTLSSRELKSVLSETRAQSDRQDEQTREIAVLKALTGDLTDKADELTTKLNAILEVQQIAYRDHTALSKEQRGNIDDVITTAKLTSTKSRAELLKKLEELEKKEQASAAERAEIIKATKRKVSAEADSKAEARSLIQF